MLIQTARYILAAMMTLVTLTGCDKLSLWQDPETRDDTDSPEELLYHKALEETTDIDEVDRIVADFRRRLIVERYVDQMIEAHLDAVTEEDCQQYYTQYKSDLKLKHYVVQGLMVQIREKSRDLNKVKKILKAVHNREYEQLDEIENICLDHSMLFEQFVDDWRPLDDLMMHVPIPVDATKLREKGVQQITDKTHGYLYFLVINDIRKPGDETPYQLARAEIVNYLSQQARSDYRQRLMRELVEANSRNNKEQ